MNIPPVWLKVTDDSTTSTPQVPRKLAVWGCGATLAEAQAAGRAKLARVQAWFAEGRPARSLAYAYGARPLREERLLLVPDDAAQPPIAIVTRNQLGVQVLNTASLLFLDIDLPARTFSQIFRGWFSRRASDPVQETEARLRETLARYPEASFRLYRTAAGFRVLAMAQEYAPDSAATQALMLATATDPAYATLCRVQQCFRARLTPKPYRCQVPRPPGRHPRTPAQQAAFGTWLAQYQAASEAFATCRYLGTIGQADPVPSFVPLLALHDHATRATSALPLA